MEITALLFGGSARGLTAAGLGIEGFPCWAAFAGALLGLLEFGFYHPLYLDKL